MVCVWGGGGGGGGSGDETTATGARPSTVCMQRFVQSDQ